MLNFDLSGKNKYYNLYLKIRAEISSGRIKCGDRLPSKRALSEQLGVSVVTVQLAYEQLLAEGYITAKQRSGYFVEEVAPSEPSPRPRDSSPAETDLKNQPKPAQEQYAIDFVKGSAPAELFPFSTWAHLIRGVLSDSGEHLLERVPCDGDFGLKKAISAYLYRSRGIFADPRYIVIGAGAEHLYGVIVQLLGRDRVFAVENPGYGKISSAYALNGARWVPVSVTDSGVSVSELEKSEASVLHVSPSHQFPTGAVTPVSNRSKLISWATERGGYVVEDDYDSEFRLSGKPLQSTYGICPEKVIYLNTFSKSLAPSMRLGYMVLPPALYEKYLSLFATNANFVPLFEQKALAAMLDGGYFERHVSRLKNHYRTVRKAVLEKLSESGCTVTDTGSGTHLIAKISAASTDEEVKERAERAGAKLKCLSDYLLAPLDGVEGCAVINYSGVTLTQLENFKGF